MRDFKVLVFTGVYLPGYKGGGPIKTIKNLIQETSSIISYKVVTSDRDIGDIEPYSNVKIGLWNKLTNHQVFYVHSNINGFFQILSIMIDEDYDVLYLNSFFSKRFSIYPALIGKLLNKKIVLSPRGEFSIGALSLKSHKKRIFIKAYKLLRLSNSIVFQASNSFEAKDIFNVLGNNVTVKIASNIGSHEFTDKLPIKSSKYTKIVFLSRISPMKNLLFALETLQKVNNDVVFDIYGPIEDLKYWSKCQDIIRNQPDNINISYKGELQPDQVITTLSNYDLFFLPTKGENYGHVITEALCSGLPILISDRTPWRGLEKDDIGWEVPLDDTGKFISLIELVCNLSEDLHHTKRQKVLSFAQSIFTLNESIDANIELFRKTIDM